MHIEVRKDSKMPKTQIIHGREVPRYFWLSDHIVVTHPDNFDEIKQLLKGATDAEIDQGHVDGM